MAVGRLPDGSPCKLLVDHKNLPQHSTDQPSGCRARNIRGLTSPVFDFIMADKGQTGALYFMANENDLVFGLKQPWTSLCLDAGELSLDGPLYESHTHPRAFGAMPRFLGRYVRDQHLLPLEQGIRKMTSLPAQRERLLDRGLLKEGYFADITVFDPATIKDVASYSQPAQISEGVKYVFVNGQLEFEDGKLTGVISGHALRGPGWKQEAAAAH